MKETLTFHLDHFSGPLEFLVALVQQEELNINDVSLKDIMTQYIESLKFSTDLHLGAEFLGSSSLLMWLKSKSLLPHHEHSVLEEEEEEADPRFEIIHHLLDYCKFREAAKVLNEREYHQKGLYERGINSDQGIKKPLGIHHLSLEDFADLFRQLIAKASSQKGTIEEEPWQVADKIELLKEMLAIKNSLEFDALFSVDSSKEELIVLFLAILELMKSGGLSILYEPITKKITLVLRQDHDT